MRSTKELKKNELLFVHMPKTGGTFIGEFISYANVCTNVVHTPISEIEERPFYLDRKKFYTFGFIRNPFDWYVSRFMFFMRTSRKQEAGVSEGSDLGMPGKHYNAAMNFEEYMRSAKDGFWMSDRYKQMFYSKSGKCIMDYIGKMETMTEDMKYVLGLLEDGDYYKDVWDAFCKHFFKKDNIRNKTDHGHYSEYFIDEFIELVYKKDKLIFDTYGYR